MYRRLKNSTANNQRPNRQHKHIYLNQLAQTFASICWIASMFAYGIESDGDWLQLVSGSAWLFANMSSSISIYSRGYH